VGSFDRRTWGISRAQKALTAPPTSLAAEVPAACDPVPEVGAGAWVAARERLRRMALALGVLAEDVPDVVQETLLAAHRARARFDPRRGSFDAWLATILIGRARNRLRAVRRRRRLAAALQVMGFATRNGNAEVARLEARLVLERLLESLTASQREVVALYEIGEMRAEEVARLLGITASGVRSIARDARRRLSAVARATRHQEEA